MATFRLYYCDGNGSRFAVEEFVAADEAHAIERARAITQLRCPMFELWHGDRLVIRETKSAAGGPGRDPPRRVTAQRFLISPIDEWKTRRDMRILGSLISKAVSRTGADTGNIQLLDGAGGLRIVAQHRLEREFLDFFAVVNGNETSCSRAAVQAQRVIVEDVTTDPIFRGKPSGMMLLQAGLRSTHSTPIAVDGKVRGMISTHRRITWKPDADELSRIDRFAADAASVIRTVVLG